MSGYPAASSSGRARLARASRNPRVAKDNLEPALGHPFRKEVNNAANRQGHEKDVARPAHPDTHAKSTPDHGSHDRLNRIAGEVAGRAWSVSARMKKGRK